MSDKPKMNIAMCDAFMAIFGYKRKAIVEGNVIRPAAFETDNDREQDDDNR